MNRKNLTAAVLAGLAGVAGIVGSAQAVNINPDGLGQVLIYPYYTVNGGNTTLLSVVNTSEDGKAVKVRFLEGQNSREVLDFNLYMSPYDVWTASLKNVDGTPRLKTGDNTCTVPYFFGSSDGKQNFLPYALTDGGSTDISRATEGHFEMIEMGSLYDDTWLPSWADAESDPIAVPVETAATHVSGVPADCAALVGAWTDPDDSKENDEGPWLDNPLVGIGEPTGGLFGGAAIVNVQQGTMYSYDAKAINGFADSPIGGDGLPLHQFPGKVVPSLNSGNAYYGTVFLDDGETHSAEFERPVDAVSFAFMHDQVMNEYTTELAVGAATEWVMTFPTKAFYVYGPSAAPYEVPVAPFTNAWDAEAADEAACELVMLDTIWDREERTIIDPVVTGEPVPPIVSPAPPGVPDETNPEIPIELCYEVSVLEFGPKEELAASGVLGSANFHEIDNTLLGFEYGWARFNLTGWAYDLDGDGFIANTYDASSNLVSWEENERGVLGGLSGLPVTGFAVQSFQNAFLGDGNDVLANYGGIFQHKATRSCGSAYYCD